MEKRGLILISIFLVLISSFLVLAEDSDRDQNLEADPDYYNRIDCGQSCGATYDYLSLDSNSQEHWDMWDKYSDCSAQCWVTFPSPDEEATCTNGIEDGFELGVDCGGFCPDDCEEEEDEWEDTDLYDDQGCLEGYYFEDGLCYSEDFGEEDTNQDNLVECQRDCSDSYPLSSFDDDDMYEKYSDCSDQCGVTFRGGEEEEEDTCFNNELDDDEDGTDCGGACMQRCSFTTSISPSSATLTADGIESKQFTLSASTSGSPLKNEKYNLAFWFPFDSKLMSDYGRISPTTITTDESGKATFTYYSPRAPDGKYLKNLNFELRATGASGAKTTIKLVDPKPRIKIILSQMSMLEGNEVNYVDVEITDEDSTEWDIKVTTSIGTLIGDYGEVNSLIQTIQTKNYDFSWNPPASAVELIDETMEYVQDHKNDWSNYESGLKSESVKAISNALVGENLVADVESQVTTWSGNVEQMQRDVNRIQTSTSSYETFLRSISFGLEGLQAYYGTKGFFDDKLGNEGSEGLTAYLEGLRDKTIDYGVDSLQSGLRYWANLVRKGSLDTRKIPVYIVVEVTDNEGFTAKESKVFQYTYYII